MQDLYGPFCRRNRISLLRKVFFCSLASLLSVYLCIKWSGNVFDTSVINYCSNSNSYKRFVVSSDAEECSLIGCNILLSGGNVIDAAIATAICTTVVNPHSTSLSAGAFLLYQPAEGNSTFFNLREVAGSNIRPELYEKKVINKQDGAGSVCVANLAKGFYEIWKKYGKLSWNELVEPSVVLAKEGFTIGSSLSCAIDTMKEKLHKYSELSSFLKNKATGEYLKEGDIYKDEVYARTLKLIGTNITFLEEEFYVILQKDLCNFFDKEYPNIGCPITSKDFEEYTVTEQTVLETKFQNKKILFGNMTSSGIMVQFILKLLALKKIQPFENTDLQAYTNYLHLLAETYKWAYAKRAGLGDYLNANDPELFQKTIEFYLNDTEIRRISEQKITETTHDNEYYEPNVQTENSHGTSHLSVIDGEGNAVALTTSINYYLGSLVRSPFTGVLFNNGMDDFSIMHGTNYYGLKRSLNNFIKPKRQPMSSMSPLILLDENNQVELAIGASGGSHIPTAISGVIANYIFRELNLKDAINYARIHHQLKPDVLQNDNLIPLDERIVPMLEKKGHKFLSSSFYSAVQAVSKNGSLLYGEADTRKNGISYGV